MRVWVTGGAGFLGSHLCEALIGSGAEVRAIDNLSSGSLENIQSLSQGFELIRRDVCEPWPLPMTRFRQPDVIYHLASLASPREYKKDPLGTIRVNTEGTIQALRFARRAQSKLVYVSTSEVYGDPVMLPQREESAGAIHPTSSRAPYSLSKAAGEAAVFAAARKEKIPVTVVRVFNTYGPRMAPDDGRCVPTFIARALRGESLQLVGGGEQTRSLCYVSDTVAALMACSEPLGGPINIGNDQEISIRDLAEMVRLLTRTSSGIEVLPRDEEDPRRRQPDISQARKLLGWGPQMSLEAGLLKTIEYFKKRRT